MMTAPAPAAAFTPHARLADITRAGLRAMCEVIPRVVWAGFKGSFAGFFLAGFLGLGVAALGVAFEHLRGVTFPTWVTVLDFVITPLAFALAGGYGGGVRGSMQKLAEELVQRRLVAYLYAIIKPSCVAALARVRAQGEGDLAVELRAQLDERLRLARIAEPDAPRSLGERLERSLAHLSERMLCLAVLRVAMTAKNRDEATQRIEALSIEHIEHLLVDTLEDLFLQQVVLAYAAALLIAAAPHLVFLLVR